MADDEDEGRREPTEGGRELDLDLMLADIEVIRRHRRITLTQVAGELGIPKARMSELRAGQRPGPDLLIAMLAWLGGDASRYVRSRRAGGNPGDGGDCPLAPAAAGAA